MKYVGARYVPKFEGTYDATQSYENMSVVDNGMGTSYISQKPVPAGTPLTDTDYWALYGASSGAIINLQNQIGTLGDLDTSNKTDLVSAINEVAANDHYEYIRGKKILIIGDSLSDENFYESRGETCWITPLKAELANICTLDVKAQSGRKMIDLPGHIGDYYTAADAYDIIIIELGTNDGYGATPTPMQGYDFGSYNPATFQGAIVYAYLQIMRVDASNPPEIWFITPPPITIEQTNDAGTTMDLYRKAIEGFCHGNNCHFIDGAALPNISVSPVLSSLKTKYQPDGVHFSTAYAPIFKDYVLSKLLTGGTDGATASDGNMMELSQYKDAGVSGYIGAIVDGTGNVDAIFNIYGTMTSDTITIMSSLPDEMFKTFRQNNFREPVTVWDSANSKYIPAMLTVDTGTLKLTLSDFTSSFTFQLYETISFKSRELIYKREFPT